MVFGFLSKLASPLLSTVSKIAKPFISTVSSFAKPIWGGVKKVAQFIPGGEQLTGALEGIGSSLLGTGREEAEGAMEEMEDMGEAIADTNLRNYRRTRGELEGGYENLKRRGGRMMDALRRGGGQFMQEARRFADTARSKQAWQDKYAQPEEEDEDDNNYRRYKARQTRQQMRRRKPQPRRRRVIEEEELD